MQVLDLAFNSLSGPLPPELGNLQNVLSFSVENNQLTGPIPAWLSNWKNVSALLLSNNLFTGSIPPELGNCQTLHHLAVDNNLLTGTIPTELCNAVNLDTLMLNDNQLSGNISETFLKCTNLAQIDLTANRLSGEIPAYLATLPKLLILSLGSNSFSGTLPNELWSSKTLMEILLSENNLSGVISPLVGTLSALQYLVLDNNNFEGSIPPEIGSLSELTVLSMQGNNFTGQIPAELCNCVRLTTLNLGNNSLSGPIPKEIGQLVNLDCLVLSHNQLTGVIPDEIATDFQVSVVPQSSFVQHHGVLDLSYNRLSGSVPSKMGDCVVLVELMLAGNLFTGLIPPELSKLTNLSSLDLSNNQFNGSIPPELGGAHRLQGLNLAFNKLSGPIPAVLGNLVSLVKMDLTGNLLTGAIPKTLGKLKACSASDLCELPGLTFLNVSENNLFGSIPNQGRCTSFTAASFLGNRALCGDALQTMCPGTMSTNSSAFPISTGAILGIALGSVVAMLSVVFVALRLRQLKQEVEAKDLEKAKLNMAVQESTGACMSLSKMKEPLSINVAMFEQPLLRLTLADVLRATNNFSKTNIIGDGGFGTVYKATLPDMRIVAIKKLGQGLSQGNREFLAEMETLGKVKHRNLVPLLGYCSFGDEKLLVYDYMVNGSLDLWLRNRADAVEVLDWPKRFRIAMGSARGLCFLHHGFIPHIIHRDIKASNILLDADFEPRVADFGLARLISAYETHVSTDIAGTFGYIPPEYGQSWRSTTRGDVYSYGVILLELLTGKEPTRDDFKDIEGGNLVGWVRQMIKKGEAPEALDTEVSRGPWKLKMLKVLHVANLCTAEDPVRRPTMLQVVKFLKDIEEAPQSPTVLDLKLV